MDATTSGERTSAVHQWPPLEALLRVDARMSEWATTPFRRLAYEFLRFGVKQAWACLFGGIMVMLLMLTHLAYPADALLTRYDFLVLASIGVQGVLIAFRLETLEEAKVIFAFHVVGTVMEIFKTRMGSWVYPEPGLLRIAGVPLFTGFMYASIGSYIVRAWRLFRFRFTKYPPVWTTVLLSCGIYFNFFWHHYGPDLRWLLFGGIAVLYGPTWIHFTIHRHPRRMPLVVAALLVTLFIWFAENIGTFTHTWRYPSQRDGWHMVPLAKLGSWYLLMIISAVLVSLVHRPRAPDEHD
ncbi:MAG: DUF817 domain-containing protein [Myxococcaceae bacterium]